MKIRCCGAQATGRMVKLTLAHFFAFVLAPLIELFWRLILNKELRNGLLRSTGIAGGKRDVSSSFSWNSVSIVLMIVGVFTALIIFGFSREGNIFFSNKLLALSVLFSIVLIIVLAAAILIIRVLHYFISSGEWLERLSELPMAERCKFCAVTTFVYGLLISVCALFAGYFVATNLLLLVSGKAFYIFKDL